MRPRFADAAAAVLFLTAACHPGHARLASCADPLDGVWADAAGQPRWQLVDHKDVVEAYPLWDTAVPKAPPEARGALVVSPWKVDLHRDGARVEGAAVYRLEHDEKRCTVRFPVR